MNKPKFPWVAMLCYGLSALMVIGSAIAFYDGRGPAQFISIMCMFAAAAACGVGVIVAVDEVKHGG